MICLTVNVGSSSLRLALLAHRDGRFVRLADAHYTTATVPSAEYLSDFLATLADTGAPTLVVHRVVHGGAIFSEPRFIDADVEREIERVSPLAPLHNPAALHWIRTCREVLGPDIRQIAVFDTAFYAALPEAARTYALPRDLTRRHGIRRYGFHGIAHQAMWERWRELRPDMEDGGRVISLQLGSGCSITAIDRGMVMDTSMGYSPLEGLVMATRAGDVDPGILLYLQRELGLTPGALERILSEESGLLGISGTTGDMRSLLTADDPASRLAVEVFCYRARKYVGAYLAVLAGADAILFGGGIGEHLPSIRRQIVAGMEWWGLTLDTAANNSTAGKEGRISGMGSRAEVWVVPVDEAAIMVQQAQRMIATHG